MENSFLPIGTVCSLKGNNKKIMIIGYMPLDFKSGLKTYDYLGVPFPEGMLLPNRLTTFNTPDILNVDYMGYQDEELTKFHNLLDDALNDNSEELNIIKNLKSDADYESDFVFNQDGVVVSENRYPVNNPFRMDLLYPNREKDDNSESNWSVFEDIKFDENGTVVSVVEKEELDVEKNYEQEGYVFDENGNVIAEN